MERDLKFVKTMSVADFKAQHQVEKIEVKRNENTGKCFLYLALKQELVQGRFKQKN